MNIDLINTIIKVSLIQIFSFVIAIKLINYKDINLTKKIIVVIISIATSFIYTIIKKHTDILLAVYILYFITSINIKWTTERNIGNSMLISVVALSMCLLSFIIAVSVEYVPFHFIGINNRILNLTIISVIQYFIIYLFFKVKRFKNGFIFLKNTIRNDFIDLIMTNISSAIILVYCLLGNYYGNSTKYIMIVFFMLGLVMIITIQRIIIIFHKQNLLKKTIEDYKNEIEEKDKKIKELSNEKFNISKLNHEFYNRQKSLELKIKEMNLEASEEIGILQRIQTVTEEYSTKLQQIKGKNKLPLTNVETIDDMLKYMQTECYNKNIDFKLQIEANINRLINNKISETKLETLIGDHIKDAIIAVNNSNNKYKSIMTIIGIKDNCYELCIYDSGIEFEIPTLLNLGLEAITTHKDTGGSGIGFITTFETLKYCKASLIIEERHKEIENDYTKAVIIRFDDKNEYKIRSYRAKEIIRQAKDNRIIIENI